MVLIRSFVGRNTSFLTGMCRMYARLYRLTKGVGVGAHEVIACEDIYELAGLIVGGESKEVFVVDKDGALWLNLAEEEDDTAGIVSSDSESESESE